MRVVEEEKVEGCCCGVESMRESAREVLASMPGWVGLYWGVLVVSVQCANAPSPAAVIILREDAAASLGLAGPTPCCASSVDGRTLKSLYSSLIFTARRSLVLPTTFVQVFVCIAMH